MNIRGSETEKLVENAFTQEAKAIGKYIYFATQARIKGREDIAILFEKMAKNEKEHLNAWLKIFYEDKDDYISQLLDAAQDENITWKYTYPQGAEVARKEGFDIIAILFDRIAAIENDHERQFTEAILKLQENEQVLVTPLKNSADEEWYTCIFCGHTMSEQPRFCPVCNAENSFA